MIVANSSPAVAALKHATSSIPIVFAAVNDPVAQGFIASLGRPGGNFTGFTLIDFPMLGKWLELLKEMVPNIRRAALMFNPNTARYYPVYLREFRALPQEMSYGPDSQDIFRRSASYVDRILKGENPAELPAQAPTKSSS